MSEIHSKNGRRGGQASTPKKTRAVQKNGALGGRPRLPEKELSDQARWKRIQRAKKKHFDAEVASSPYLRVKSSTGIAPT